LFAPRVPRGAGASGGDIFGKMKGGVVDRPGGAR